MIYHYQLLDSSTGQRSETMATDLNSMAAFLEKCIERQKDEWAEDPRSETEPMPVHYVLVLAEIDPRLDEEQQAAYSRIPLKTMEHMLQSIRSAQELAA